MDYRMDIGSNSERTVAKVREPEVTKEVEVESGAKVPQVHWGARLQRHYRRYLCPAARLHWLSAVAGTCHVELQAASSLYLDCIPLLSTLLSSFDREGK